MLDGFLELSVSSNQLLADIGLLEKFGFKPAETNDVWTHPYGVVSDGRCHIGLHGINFDQPILSFVMRDLAQKLAAFSDLLISFDHTYLGDNEVHEAVFSDPSGQKIRLIEARTYSPVPPNENSLLGQFKHVLLPGDNASISLWNVLQNKEDDNSWIKIDENCDKLTLVFSSSLEQLIINGASQGWKNFSINEKDQGIVKTQLGFDILIDE